MTAHARGSHAIRCLWFWAWAAVGALAALALDLGLFAAAPALSLGALLANVGGQRHRSAPGFLTGAGLPLLWVAYVQRQGPGTTCWHTAWRAGCDQHLDPLPWLISGAILVLTGLFLGARDRR